MKKKFLFQFDPIDINKGVFLLKNDNERIVVIRVNGFDIGFYNRNEEDYWEYLE